MKVLFSPIGNTDPIPSTNTEEGSLIHICRFYQPEKIYLYMSKAILDIHKKDNRYILFLKELYRCLGKELDYEIIEREDLIDVHKFDDFYSDFRVILDNIHKENPKADILLNISSGTPAMKSALFVLTAFRQYKLTPIQVSAPFDSKRRPISGINKGQEAINPLDYLHIIEENTIFAKDYKSRCEIASRVNLNYELKKEIINNHLKEYNYPAALSVAETIKDFLSEKSFSLIEAANERFALNSYKMNLLLHKIKENFFTHRGDYADIVEYMLYVDVLRKRELLLEFLRALTPLNYELFLLNLKLHCGFDTKNLIRKTEKGDVWNLKNLYSEEFEHINNILNFNPNNPKQSNIINNFQLYKLIENLETQRNIVKQAKILRSIEANARNEAAHQIVCIDENSLKDKTGFNSEEIMNHIKKFVKSIDINLNDQIWNSYDMMNQKIKSSY
ncbi:MAG: hypothetical protein Q4P29_06290 [Tissierellia bacterium]|nr:hypothetical protein [Tissierellia bacterium]